MPTYTVHAPPPKRGETTSAPERFRFVRDGFHFWAFLITPVWLIVHRLWLALFLYVVVYGLLGVGLALIGASSNVQLLVGLLIGLLMGFEASSIRRWTLMRRGWRQVGFVVGDDMETAERRFYAEWTNRPPAAPPAPPPAGSAYTAPMPRGAASGNDVIGLFPEPGGSR